MNPDIRLQLQELAAAEELPEWQRSSRLLGLALRYCRAALEETQDRAALLQGLAALALALKAGGADLGDLARVLQRAAPGVTLKQALEQSRAGLAERQKELADLQAAVAELEASEAQWKALEIERDRLRSRLEYLQRLSQQADPQELEKLRKEVSDRDSGDVALNIIIS